MLVAGPEEDRDGKGDDRSEKDPPGKFDSGQPVGLCVGDATEDSSDRIEEIANDRYDDESDNHRDDVAEVAAATSGEHSTKKNTEDRPVGVGEDAQTERTADKVRKDNDQIRSDRRNDNH